MLRSLAGREEKCEILVRKEGFEPPRPFGHKILSLARLPVPPLPQWCQLTDYTGVLAPFVLLTPDSGLPISDGMAALDAMWDKAYAPI